MIADIVVPTPALQTTSWVALVFGLTWLIMFSIVVRNDIKQKETSVTYRAACFLCLVAFVVLSLVVNIGVVASDTA